MPSSCQELRCLGHELNGLYFVKGANKKKIESIYCNFDRSASQTDSGIDSPGSFIESRLGFIDVKTSPVHFYVQRNRIYSTAYSVIPWELARLNIGNAMDLSSGVFTAPKTGVYHFHFSGHSVLSNYFQITLQLNGMRMGYAISDSRITSNADADAEYHPGSLHSRLKLKKGDQIDLWLHFGALYDDGNHFSHFTGWLDDEDLQFV